ncbi:MAG: hypothetical protein ACLPIX_10880 [Rhodomicrobium sp.]
MAVHLLEERLAADAAWIAFARCRHAASAEGVGPAEHISDIGPVEQIARRFVCAAISEAHLCAVLPNQRGAIETGEVIGIG